MMHARSQAELDAFLARHAPVEEPALLGDGAALGAWRVTAFLGSGGFAEVYRVVQAESGQVAAAKVLLRDDAASRERFRQEAGLLKAQQGVSLARYYDGGEVNGRPYMILELLESVDLPESEKAIAAYVLSVCRAVGVLHRAGIVHRDLKPSNVMRRADGELVLIDLGLAKDVRRAHGPARDVSVVSGRVVAVGTPRFAAPEQMTGGEVTAAADIHALGCLIDAAFGARPPQAWQPIVRRATSSLPGQRYASVEELARAVRRRHWGRRAAVATAAAAIAAAGLSLLVNRVREEPLASTPRGIVREAAASTPRGAAREAAAWAALCAPGVTNVVDRRLVSEGGGRRVYRKVPRRVEATFVRLNSVTNRFLGVLELTPGREWFIEGPGVLSADLRASAAGVVVHLRNGIVVNRSQTPLDEAGIRYVFEGGAGLRFPFVARPDRETFVSCFENYDAGVDDVRFGSAERVKSDK